MFLFFFSLLLHCMKYGLNQTSGQIVSSTILKGVSGGGDSTTTEWRLFDVCSQREEIECSPFKVSFLI